MADTFTPNYNLVLPGIGGDVNTWGTLLNGNFSAIDTGMAANLDLAATRPLTGNLLVKKASPSVAWQDSSQILPAGAWRIRSASNQMQVQRNTANAGDFSTSTIPFWLDNADRANLLQGLSVGADIAATGAVVSSANVQANANLVAMGTSVAVGSGQNAILTLAMHNANTSGQLQLDTSGGLGFYDIGRNIGRFTSDAAGNFTANGNITAFSDERLKTDWKSLPPHFVEMAAQTTTGTYTRKDTGERQAGTIAQEWLAILGEVVGTDASTGLHTLAYGNAALVLAIELAKRVVALEATVRDSLK